MKILDRYIFVSFVKTFFSVFTILILIFLLQSIWVYISELAGKDLDAIIIAKLLFYIIPNLIPMVLPLTILVASIMTFGSFAENYEFAAMKSSGISLQRAMRSLIFFISILSIVTFFFANDVIPWSKYKTINMRSNIKKMKPALAIVEGSFNQIDDYNIKVEKKTGKNGQDLHNVIIHKTMEDGKGLITIKSKTGKLKGSENSEILSLILYDGTQYQRLYPKNYRERQRMPFIKNGFDEYRFNIDLSGFNDVDVDDDNYSNSASMLNISELRVALDSMTQKYDKEKLQFSQTLMSRNGLDRLLGISLPSPQKKDTVERKILGNKIKSPEETKHFDLNTLDEFFNSYDFKEERQIANIALTITQGSLRTIKGRHENFKKKLEDINNAKIEIHDKFALAVMCFILFFIGAPLGAIIRKGGIGTPMVVAIILFLTYYYIGMFAKNSAKDGSISPFFATWLSTFIMFPLSILVTYQATTDRSFFNADIIMVPLKKFFSKIGLTKLKKKKNNS